MAKVSRLEAAQQGYNDALRRNAEAAEVGRNPPYGVAALAMLQRRVDDALAEVVKDIDLTEERSTGPGGSAEQL